MSFAVAGRSAEICRVEGHLWVASQPQGVAAYDFDLGRYFSCDHPYLIEGTHPCILRLGPLDEYERLFDHWQAQGLTPINTPAQHRLASELECWYPLLEDMTPQSQVFDRLPPAEEVEDLFSWPIFLKGSRQTSRHKADLCIIHSREHYEQARARYAEDLILHWQKPVVRKFVPLAPLPEHASTPSPPGSLPPALEFRTFWWKGTCVGHGPYWHTDASAPCPDLQSGLTLAGIAAQRMNVPFLVVDIAKTLSGSWTVIECNDAQESGYAGVSPLVLWRNILAQEDIPAPIR